MSDKLVPIGSIAASKIGAYDKAVQAFDATATGGSGWQFVSLKDQVFRLNPAAPGEETLDVIIVAATKWNQHRHPYVEGQQNVATPICYAIQQPGESENQMGPPADWPTKVSDACHSCPLNEWGSDPRGGRGKGCSNQVHLAILPADNLEPSALEIAVGRRIVVSPTALKGWAEYLGFMKGKGLAPFQLVTRFAFQGKTLTFQPVGGLPTESSDAVHDRYQEALDAVLQDPPTGDADIPKPAPRTKTVRKVGGTKKKVGRKKVGRKR